MLTKNNFLAQLMCLFGLQEYILLSNHRRRTDDEMLVDDKHPETGEKLKFWEKQQLQKKAGNSVSAQYHDT
jgi:hypothetical protein